MKVADIESLLPDPAGPNALPPPAPDKDVVIKTMELAQKDAHFNKEIQFKIMDLQQELAYLQAEIAKSEAQAALYLAQAEGIEAGHQVAAIQQSVSLMKQKQDGIIATMKILEGMQKLELEKEKINADKSRGVSESKT
jgi:hypothetical protein